MIDLTSATWKSIEAHLQARIAELQERLTGDQDHYATARLRGQIVEARMLLELPKEQARRAQPQQPLNDFNLED